MAKYVVPVGGVAGVVALVAATTQTIMQIQSGAKRLELKELGISFDGTSPSAVPVVVEVLRQTTAGTASSTAQVPLQQVAADGPALATYSKTFTVEPTASDILRNVLVTPNGGLFVLPLDGLWVATSSRLGLRANAPANVNVIAYLVFDE